MPDAPDIASLERAARRIRATCVQVAHDAKVGHVGSAYSCVEALVALYYHWLSVSPTEPRRPDRDRFILSKGHGCTALYAALADRGFIPKEFLGRYATADSPLPDHPCQHALPLLETSSGSLGNGLGVASGMLYGLRLDGNPARVAVLMSDGECNEGAVWESAIFAAAHGLDKLVALVDYNGLQAVGRTDTIMGPTSIEEKFRGFGWSACTVDGNDVAAVIAALDRVPFAVGWPTALILKTVKGAGVSFMEDEALWHYRVPRPDDLSRALAELGESPIHAEKKP